MFSFRSYFQVRVNITLNWLSDNITCIYFQVPCYWRTKNRKCFEFQILFLVSVKKGDSKYCNGVACHITMSHSH